LASGDIIWLLDVIAPSQKLATRVIANFRQVLDAKDLGKNAGQMRFHPIIKRMLGDEVLQKMGARPLGEAEKPADKVKAASAKKKAAVEVGAKALAKGSSPIN